MAIQSSLKNMALVLTGTCLVCSALLGVAYVVTKDPIAKAEKEATVKALKVVLPEFDEVSDEALTVTVDGAEYPYYVAKKGGEVVGYAIESKTGGFGGELVVMVGIDAITGYIYNTAPLKHSETPGLGAKCTDEQSAFRKQWCDPKSPLPVIDGDNAAVYAVKKEGGTIDAITASTITSKAYTKCVNQALAAFVAIVSEPVISSEVEKSMEDPCNE